MKQTLVSHGTLRPLSLCALYAFVLLFFLSPDSYLRDVFYRFDSAWFFMCGKAWMNGLVPYVDFADSKGPLLWLIYGIGYLLSHHSFVGVFWLSVLFYTATLYIAYKLCRLFLEPKPAALCVALLPLALFAVTFHNETRSEDFCYPFIMCSFYSLCRQIHDERLVRRMRVLLNAGMGMSFMCVLLIKWNIAVMLGTVMIVVLYLALRQRVFLLCIGSMVAGAVLVALPFLVYFLAFADFGAFVSEYFLYTFNTVKGTPLRWCIALVVGAALIVALFLIVRRKGVAARWGRVVAVVGVVVLVAVVGFVVFTDMGALLSYYAIRVLDKLKEHASAHGIVGLGWRLLTKELLTIILFVGILLFGRHHRRYAWLILCFLAFRICMGAAPWGYYYTVLTPFFAFALIYVVGHLSALPWWRASRAAALCVVAAVCVVVFDMLPIAWKYRHAKEDRTAFYAAAYVMSQIEKPRVLCRGHECCVSVPVGALPTARHWAIQNGAPAETRAEWDALVAAQAADFVVVYHSFDAGYEALCSRIEGAGYVHYVDAIVVPKTTFSLYGRPGLSLPPPDFHVSDWDVYLKRNIFGI